MTVRVELLHVDRREMGWNAWITRVFLLVQGLDTEHIAIYLEGETVRLFWQEGYVFTCRCFLSTERDCKTHQVGLFHSNMQ